MEQATTYGITKRNIDDTMMGQSAHDCKRGALLATAWGGSRDEHASVFAVVAAGGPLLTSLVPEGFPLSREVAVTGGDAHEEGVVLRELGWVCELGD